MDLPPTKRVLFFGEAVTLSHVVRPAVLAQALDHERYQVTFACDSRYNSLVADLPFAVVSLSSAIDQERLLEVLAGNEPIFDAETLEGYVEEDLRLIDEHSPDLVVGDMRQSLAISGQLRRVPYLNIIGAQWSPYANVEIEALNLPMKDVLGEQLAQVLFWNFLTTAGSFHHSFPLNAVRVKRGLPPISWDARHIYSYGDYVAYPDIPEIIATSNLPANHSYLGPVLWSPRVPLPDWWDTLPEDVPVIYLNLGSSGQPELVARVLEALAEFKVTVIAATGGKDPGIRPPNAYLADYLPGGLAATRSTLVICNGGSMPAHQALAAGAPVLGLVSNIDQLVFARAVQRAGAAEVIREQDATVAEIRRLVWRILATPRYREKASRIATLFAGMDAPTRFRDLVARILG